jgi:hypothetical protein
MAKAPFDIPTQLPDALTRPIYAGVGVTDRVVEIVRETVADVQKRVHQAQQDISKTVGGLDYQPRALREQATKAVSAGVDTLAKDAEARRRALEQSLGDLQSDAKNVPVRVQQLVGDQVATAGETYDELVRRGETVVGRIRRQQSTRETAAAAQTTVAKARTTRTQATRAAKQSASTARKTARKSPAKSSAKATGTSARKTAAAAATAATDAAAKLGD